MSMKKTGSASAVLKLLGKYDQRIVDKRAVKEEIEDLHLHQVEESVYGGVDKSEHGESAQCHGWTYWLQLQEEDRQFCELIPMREGMLLTDVARHIASPSVVPLRAI